MGGTEPTGHTHHHLAEAQDHMTHRRAVRAIWVSALVLGLTAAFQFAVVAVSGSAALFADGLHNIGDVAGTASLWVAFSLSRRAATDEFTYGWRRAEDIAGLVILLAIAVSAALAGYDSVQALLTERHDVTNFGWAILAALVGVAGNEGVAQYKIRVGRAIDSVPLMADGKHARTDGLASLAAAVGIGGAWLDIPLADPVAGLAITVWICGILYTVGRDVLRRMMDAVSPEVVPRVREVACAVEGVVGVHDVRARHLGRTLHLALHVEVDPSMEVRAAHVVAEGVRHELAHALAGVDRVDVHLDPAGEPSPHETTAHHFGTCAVDTPDGQDRQEG